MYLHKKLSAIKHFQQNRLREKFMSMLQNKIDQELTAYIHTFDSHAAMNLNEHANDVYVSWFTIESLIHFTKQHTIARLF